MPHSTARRGFAPFAISFSALYFIWVAHTNVFRRYQLGDTYTLIVNGILLFTVLFYVYPLKFMATAVVAMVGGNRDIVLHYDQVGPLFMIYGLGWTMVFVMIALLYRHASKSRQKLGIDALAAYDAYTLSRHYLAFAAAGVLSTLLAYFDIGVRYGVPGFVYSIVGPLSAWNGASRRKAREIVERVGTGDFDVAPPPVITPSAEMAAVGFHEAQTGAH